ncbi:efflux RND transporter permease subunit [Flavobacterium sp. HSC-61S13]|uniref:efflux RND transporter permease subunit n=1 Tax=Flavobacterium sp. HSC-61S13 TaxID=2910963 RepID=UPI0020A12D3C|nr:efflux RND transporter permease subunit [Flavobacterium sp. HSC-61S13]MCP1996097.1 HAE1 family hydrophobic/amphiphilic exporter-1 [Flavobacterium sp. HSC-61S13]
MFKIFIQRPVLATVISIFLVMLGLLGLYKLPLQQFPDIALPAVQVNATYPGANAETILRSVAPSLEEAINGVENMSYIRSTASNDGSLTIVIYFRLGTDPDQAAVNVQNRVSQATSQLPQEVLLAGITTTKQQNSLIMVLGMYTEDETLYDQTFLSNYAQINIIPEIKRIPGVGKAGIDGGDKSYAMRVWLNPTKMANYNLTPTEVYEAINDNNLEAAPGKLGANSTESFEYVIKYKGKLNKPIDYESIIVRMHTDGSLIRLRDVARIEFGAATYTNHVRINGKPGINIDILQAPGSNSNEIQKTVAEIMSKAEKNLPHGIKQATIYNTKEALDQSIEQVIYTLIEAFIFVFIVVFLFLQDIRSTLIPAISAIVAIIGTFFFMYIFGFSINLLTLFALILSIGIVVDDAIVVVEAVHSKMHQEHMPAKEATLSAMSEITQAIISITLVMSAVFLPVSFTEGSTGVFYRQFALTLAIAILLSAINALTLSPALAAILLKVDPKKDKALSVKTSFKERFFTGFNTGFEKLTNKYARTIRFLIQYKWWSMSMLIVVASLTLFISKKTPTGFIPSEDLRFIVIALSMPAGTSQYQTEKTMQRSEALLQPLESNEIVNALYGSDPLTGTTSPSAGAIFMLLKPAKARGEIQDINLIMEQIRKRLTAIKEAEFFVFTVPTVAGFSNVDGLDMVLQDRMGRDLHVFGDVSDNFIKKLQERPEIDMAFTSFKSDYPQLEIQVDKEKAAQLHVRVRDILETMQTYFGSTQASDFNRFGKYFRVILQADKSDRSELSAMDAIYVQNKLGEKVPLNSLVRFERSYGPETASRYNLFNSIGVNAIPNNGYSTGDAINAVDEVALQYLPAGYSYEFTGMTKEEIASSGQSLIIFLISILFIYFILAALYESYILPLAILFSIPTGLLGVFLAIGMVGIENNIYIQVALLMLIGLLAKNAILIVEFAIQRRRSGKSLLASAIEASKLRLRPILMTSFAFTAGLIPMMRVTGPSAMGNQSISVAATGGMLSGVLLGIFIIPVLYVLFQYLHEKISGKTQKLN